jgi:hypothetical protein
VSETFDLRGRWWLPDHEGHQVFGTLTWSAEEGGTLHLHDELRPVVWLDNALADGSVQRYRPDRGEFQRTYPLIFGRVENRAYTLLDSFRLTAREYDEDNRTEKIHVNRFLEGAWFDDPDELRVDRVVIDMRHLTGWVNHTGLEVEWVGTEGMNDDVFAVVTARSLPAFETEHDGIGLRLWQRLGGTGDHLHDLGVEQSWAVRLHTADHEPLGAFIDTASDFQDLISIAVGKTAQHEKVVLHHPDVPLVSLTGEPIGNLRHDITYYIRWSNRSAPCEPVKRHDMYFTFDDLGGIEGVGRWLAVAADYRTELGRVMATRYREGAYVEDRIMNVSAALDSFDKHRRRVDDAHYVDRIKQCVELAGQPFLDLIAQDPDDWAKHVKETRHDLAHHRERFRTEGTVGDYLLAEQLFWLFVLCVLRVAEAPDAVYDRISNHSQIRWLTERASGAAADAR